MNSAYKVYFFYTKIYYLEVSIRALNNKITLKTIF